MSTAQALKLELIEWLAGVNDKALIKELAKWKEEHEHISVEQYNRELDKASKRIESGDYVSHDDVVKESAQWLK